VAKLKYKRPTAGNKIVAIGRLAIPE